MTPEQAVSMVTFLVERIPSGNFMKPANIKAYAEELVDLDIDDARMAAKRLVASCEKFPSIAEIREAVLALRAGPKLDPLEAWGVVELAVRKFGRDWVPRFKDKDIEHCVRMMGWKNICDSDNEVADRAHFAKMYSAVRDRGRKETMTHTNMQLPDNMPVLRLKGMP